MIVQAGARHRDRAGRRAPPHRHARTQEKQRPSLNTGIKEHYVREPNFIAEVAALLLCRSARVRVCHENPKGDDLAQIKIDRYCRGRPCVAALQVRHENPRRLSCTNQDQDAKLKSTESESTESARQQPL